MDTFPGEMTHSQGVNETTDNQQMIAFYIHTIDVYLGLASKGYHRVPTPALSKEGPDDSTYRVTGTNSSDAFLGAAREGFRKAVFHLPEQVRDSVMDYYDSRVGNYARHNPFEHDIMFGTKDPFS